MNSNASTSSDTYESDPGRCCCRTWARAHEADLTEQALTEHHSRCPWHPEVDPRWLLDPKSQAAYAAAVLARGARVVEQPPKTKMIRDHVQRVAALTKKRTGKTPDEIEAILAMPNPECQCEEAKPRYAHGTWICTKCGGIAVPDLTPDMMSKMQAAAAAASKAGIDPAKFPKDSLGRVPEVFKSGEPVECVKCREEGKHVYARFAKKERVVWCPRGHTPKPASMKSTRQLVRRGRRRAKA